MLSRMILGSILALTVAQSLRGTEVANPHLQLGITLLQQRNYTKARRQLLEAVRIEPASAAAFFYLGMADAELHRKPEAEAALRRSLQLNPRSVSTLYNLGVLLLMQGRAREAVPYLKRANQIGPPNPALSINLVRAYLDTDDEGRALSLASSAGSEFEGSAAFHLALGRCFLAHRLLRPAVQALDTANRLAPAQADIVMPLGAAYLEEKDASDALKVLASIASQARQSPEYHNLLATGYFLTGRKQETLAEMSRAVQLDPGNPAYLVKFARYEQKYGDQRKAVSLLTQAATLAPNAPAIPYSIAVSYFSANNLAATVRFLDQAIRLDPRFDAALFLLGITQLAEAKFPEAEASLKHALALKPRNPYYHCFYGMLLMAGSKLIDARTQLKLALQLDPSYGLAHYQFGRLLAREENYAAACRELKRAIALEPGMTEAYWELAHAYVRLGQVQKAQLALTAFKKHHALQYSEREEILKRAREAVQAEP
jgi:tetratricopeptide (TPR) repeat protein